MALHKVWTAKGTICRFAQVAENLLPAACTYHTTATRHNSNKISVTRSGRWKYERSYPVLLVRPDGSTVSIRYKEPRRILMMPLDISTLSEEEKKARLKKHEQKRAEVKPVVEEFEDDFKVDDYSKFWKK
ncbi:large ribosomal subunit protein mL55 isoform X1 [Paramormyrops kingsleyae]|uniref:Zgc:171480 n=1 Tax=Paramormyrops kingsleyae TaxID=1676925 RepID=A0A3B3RWX1_9TELE|nr:39S ribosomal protein L55, mitochondrial isoform X1 [Paramormyrops kingsleyae]